MQLKPGVVVVREVDDVAMPRFGCIQEIFVGVNGRILLGTYDLEIIEYSSHFHSRIVRTTRERKLITADSLYVCQCLTGRHINTLPISYKLITLKYAL